MSLSVCNFIILLFTCQLIFIKYGYSAQSDQDSGFFSLTRVDESSYNSLRGAFELYLKYQQLLEENTFYSSAQKKLVREKYKWMKNLLTNYLNENATIKEMISKVNSDLTKSKQDGANSKSKENIIDSIPKSRQPFKLVSFKIYLSISDILQCSNY